MRDERIEAWLDSHGATYTYVEDLALQAIDVKESRANQARLTEVIDDDTVLVYAEAVNQGEQMPPIVVFRKPRHKTFTIIDGNHRHQAHLLADKDHVSAYVLENPTDAQVSALTYEANTKHGKPTTLAERIIQGQWLVAEGASVAEASRMLKVPAAKLQHELGKAKSMERLAKVAPEHRQSVDSSTVKRLHNLRSDTVFKAAVGLAAQAPMDQTDISEMVTHVNKASTEADQLNIVAQYRKHYEGVIAQTAGGRIALPTDIAALQRLVIRVRRLSITSLRKTLKANGMSDVTRDTLAKQVDQAIKHLSTAKVALAKEGK